MTKASPQLLEVAQPEAGHRQSTTLMTDPTFVRLQAHRRRRRSSVLLTIGALAFVAAVGAAGLYALTRSHAALGSTAPPMVSQAPPIVGPG